LAKILVVEDEKPVSEVIHEWLTMEHHAVEVIDDGQEALNRLKVYSYDLIVLDLNLPGVPGIELLRSFRARGGTTPVLLLTGKGAIDDKERGLDAGADDYLTKPFHGRELSARIRALLRRPSNVVGDVLHFGEITLDRGSYKATLQGKDLKLVPSEFALLEFLMRNPNRVFSPEELLNKVWADDSEATVGAVTTCVKRLRKKIDIDDAPSIICTVHGVGYKLALPDRQ
jgi:DNA-binding response OmpR family regulator